MTSIDFSKLTASDLKGKSVYVHPDIYKRYAYAFTFIPGTVCQDPYMPQHDRDGRPCAWLVSDEIFEIRWPRVEFPKAPAPAF